MTVLITGSSGFVGRHLMARCADLGLPAIPLDIHEGVDLGDWNQIQGVDKFDVCVHMAANTHLKERRNHAHRYFYQNVVSTLNVLELCRIQKAKMIYISSYVYGDPVDLPVDETHSVVGFNPYAKSKILGEQLCLSYSNTFKLPMIILRPFNLYGKGQQDVYLIPSVIKGARTGQITIHDLEPKRDFLHVSDFVSLLIQCIDYIPSGSDIFNAGSGISHSVSDVIDIVCSQFIHPIAVENMNQRRENEIAETLADISKANRVLKWHPMISFDEGIKQLIDD